jgi:hypothetical protein
MKTTVDIPEMELQDAMKYAKAKTKREAIVTALVDYNRRQRMAELVKYSGTSDTLMSNEAIEALDGEDWRNRKSTARDRGRRP